MREIARVKPNGRVVVSTFAGCGGSSLGYRMAGYRVAWANEFVQEARDTYALNADHATIIDGRDVRSIRGGEILKAIGIKRGNLDLLDGSPPCAAYSVVGRGRDTWGKVRKYSDVTQRTDDLWGEYLRLLEELEPKVFVAENVTGFIKGAAKGAFLETLKAMKKAGYVARCKVLDAQWLGVPQVRRRTIFIGVREDLNREPPHPKPLKYRYTVRDILPHVQRIQTGFCNRYWRAPDEPMGTVCASDAKRSHRAQIEVAGKGGAVARRKFTIDELKLVCGFPADFALTGTWAQQWERLGRAVPPLMMFRIAREIERQVFSGSLKGS